jgi:aryl-alcohol dehydrogenase-like predicted oxidoreductase
MNSPIFNEPIHRRSFIKGMSAATAGLMLANPLGAAETNATAIAAAPGDAGIPQRTLGKTGAQVSIIGIGGHTLATAKDEATSIRIVHEAMDAGVNFMDNAACYHDGRSEEVMGKALAGGRRDKVFLMTKMCTHGKTKEVGMRSLEDSLRRLQTDHLDLWMIHQLDTMEQVDAAFAKGGSVEALDEARQQGKVRHVGFTGHVSAEIHLAMLKHDYPFDVVLMPVNAFEAHRAGFRTQCLPEVNRRGLGSLGIKSLGGNAKVVRDGKITAEQALHFALSQPITVQIVGMKSVEELRENLDIVRRFKPMPKAEQEKLTARCALFDATRYCGYRAPGYRDGDTWRVA